MLHLEINVKRRHIYALVAAVALIVTLIPISSWAADQFVDVPDSNIFHDDITWMADNGITLGCNPPSNDRFCPTDNVRRETMAAFMRRLAENQVVDAKTAIDAQNADNATNAANAANAADADKLDGSEPTQYRTVSASTGFDWWDEGEQSLSSTATPLVSTTLTAPASGTILVAGSGAILVDSASEFGALWIEIDDGTCSSWSTAVSASSAVTGAFSFEEHADASADVSIAVAGGESVTAGAHTVTLCAAVTAGTGTAWNGGMTATWMAEGTAVAGVAGITGSGGPTR